MLKNKVTLLFLLPIFFILTTCKKIEKVMMVTTGEATNILTNSADVTGQIVDLGEGATQYGHCYSKTSNITIADSKIQLGKPTGTISFTSHLTNLEAGTKYYVKAYISKDGVTKYGDVINLTTLQPVIPVYVSSVIENATPNNSRVLGTPLDRSVFTSKLTTKS